MNDLLPRALQPTLAASLRRFPVVVVTGARQTGKSTLVRDQLGGSRRAYRSLDELEVLERAEKEPDALVEEAARLTLDEVQRTPDLLRAVKRSVDRDRRAGRFLLTGSANLLMMRRISETLAGRAVYLTLWPLSEAEKKRHPASRPWSRLLRALSMAAGRRALPPELAEVDWTAAARAGGYPPAAAAPGAVARAHWLDGYVRTYLERDLQDLSSVANLVDFRRLMRLAALRIGSVVNQTELGRDAGLPQATTHRYLNLLETSFLIVRIPAYSPSRTKRLVKSPKLYWTDPGLAAHLAGLDAGGRSRDEAFGGAWLENLILLQLLVWRETVTPRPEILFWRTHAGEEVDFVLEFPGRLLPIEVKQTRKPRLGDARGLRAFLDEYSRLAPFGLLLYGGHEVFPLASRVLAVPCSAALGDLEG